MNVLTLIAATLIALSSQARADDIEDAGPQYIAGGQYSAVLEQASGRWQLLPLDAQDQEVVNDCRQQVYLPKGVWLLNRDRQGNVELIATSGTALPPGHRETVRLIACEAAGAQPSALRAPHALISWLSEHSGAVLVGE
jgi:hypothetical protein